MTKEEEPVEEVWSCSALSSWVPANLGSSHKLDDHAETTRVTSGGRKAQDPGNTKDTGKTNRKANFSVALEHADTFFWDEEGPETSGLKLLRKQDLQPGCFSYTDWDKSGGWPCFCERWHIPPDCSGHFQQLSLALPSPSPPTDPQTNHMPFKNIFQNSTSCSPSHSWVGPTADLPPALPQSTEEPQQAKSCERWGPRQTMEQEAECVLCVSSGMAMGHTILGENTVKRPLKSKKVNKGTPFLKSIYSINC